MVTYSKDTTLYMKDMSHKQMKLNIALMVELLKQWDTEPCMDKRTGIRNCNNSSDSYVEVDS